MIRMAPIQWMSSGEAAEFLGITPRTLMKFINNGSLPGYRFGRVIRLKATDVEGFIETLRIQPGDLDHLLPKPTAVDVDDG
jgi:excisionase family DNA binding protein